MADRKTVCIIGAGPSGLVAAKNLLWDRHARRHGFRVTLFESQPRIGGLWPSKPDGDQGHGLVHPQMLANQSRHTMQLSGLAWEEGAPEFPRAWQVGAYLAQYYERYCKAAADAEDGDLGVKLGCRVVKAEPINNGKGGWHVWTQPTGGDGDIVDAGVFDCLVVASGYFGNPIIPAGLQTTTTTTTATTATSENTPESTPQTIPVIHSSAYRDLDTLFAANPHKRGKILVVGGQFSGVEIAGTIANHLSSARHSPSPKGVARSSTLPDPDAVTMHHLIQRPFWVFPLHTSPSPTIDAPPFLPFDLTSYNLRKRPQPLADTQGHITVETARVVHGLFEKALGTDQADIHPALAMRGDQVRDTPPYMAVSDTYLEHVRSGAITLSKGKLASVNERTATITSMDEEPSSINDVVAVVLATGFSAAESLAFFPDAVKQALHFDARDTHQHIALAFHSTHHPAVARLAFVGFYRSPYWGVIEMQARLATALFVSDSDSQSSQSVSSPTSGSWVDPTPEWPQLAEALAADRSIERTLALRADPQRASQFPMGDYLYLMHSFGEALGVRRRGVEGEDKKALSTAHVSMDVVTPAHYVSDDHNSEVSAEDQKDMETSLAHTRSMVAAGLHDGRFVARAVFRSLQGTWRLDRQLTSRLPSHPSGRFLGTAEFRLRAGTKDGLSTDTTEVEDEYLYVEDGTFTAANGGPSFRATRRYVWRYNARDDRLSVWFARTDDAARADYLFHELEFSAPPQGGWTATAGHLCIQDFYDVQYQFSFAGVNVTDWRLQYAVRGPKKDYTIAGTYRRPQK